MTQRFIPSRPHLLLLLASAAHPACIITTDSPNAESDTEAPDQSTGQPEEDSTGIDGACPVLEQDDIAQDTTLAAGCYEVRSYLQLSGATLILEPGVDIEFAPQAGLLVASQGTLTAVGSSEAPIVLRGSTQEAGSWLGIQFTTTASQDNRLARVEVLGAGSSDALGGAVRVDSTSRLTLDAVTISDSAGPAFVADDGAQIEVSGSTFTASALPMRVGIHALEGVAEDNALSGNDRDIVELTGDTLSAATRWPALPVPLRPLGSLNLTATLTASPGVRIEWAQEQAIRVQPMGALSAIGTADAPIIFAGATAGTGFWQGISFASNTADNVLEHVEVSGAGSGMWTGHADSTTAIHVETEGKVRIANSTISGSGGYALFADEGADIGGFSSNRIEGNTRAVIVSPDVVGDIGAETVFVDNAEQRVRVSLTSLDALDRAQTWNALAVPYLVTQRIDVYRDLVVAPGATIEFAMGAYFAIAEMGTLWAVGTADEPIVFTGTETVPGFWRGLEFATISTSNRLEHCRVEYGGGEAWSGAANSEAAVQVGGFYTPGRVELQSVTIAHSGGNGLQVYDDGSSVSCADVSYQDIALMNAQGVVPPECG